MVVDVVRQFLLVFVEELRAVIDLAGRQADKVSFRSAPDMLTNR
jgi:hypothetical protein